MVAYSMKICTFSDLEYRDSLIIQKKIFKSENTNEVFKLIRYFYSDEIITKKREESLNNIIEIKYSYEKLKILSQVSINNKLFSKQEKYFSENKKLVKLDNYLYNKEKSKYELQYVIHYSYE